jgi:hypothetical protein
MELQINFYLGDDYLEALPAVAVPAVGDTVVLPGQGTLTVNWVQWNFMGPRRHKSQQVHVVLRRDI